jgi:hypothetical protein
MAKLFKNMGIVESKEINIFYLGIYAFFFCLIVFGNFSAFSHTRWNTSLDLNQDNVYSISDLISWVLWIFHMPGDFLIQSILTSQSASAFFEVSVNSFGKTVSTIFSFIFWHIAGGKKLVKFWFIVLLLIMLKNLPGIPFLY